MSKKRVFDKNLGVELHLDGEDSANETNQSSSRPKDDSEPKSKKKAKLDNNNQANKHIVEQLNLNTNYNDQTRSPSSISSSDIVNCSKASEQNDCTSEKNDWSNNSRLGIDSPNSDNENYEDIDYGDDDDDENYNDEIGKYLMEENCRTNDDSKIGLKSSKQSNADADDDDLDDDQDQRGDSEHDNEDESESNQQNEKNSNERCKYWPTCNAGKTCTYYHPSKPCRAFPNCRFGQDCLYMHPTCKYIPNCTRPGCPFAHPLKASKPNFITTPHITAPKCKYGFSCKNLMCKFMHQPREPCRFGANCLLNNCPYTHPSDMAKNKQANAFKWKANSS